MPDSFLMGFSSGLAQGAPTKVLEEGQSKILGGVGQNLWIGSPGFESLVHLKLRSMQDRCSLIRSRWAKAKRKKKGWTDCTIFVKNDVKTFNSHGLANLLSLLENLH